ncbi:MAG: DNA polymerase III subunit beta, partial [Deltaproteobacteria bacterium]
FCESPKAGQLRMVSTDGHRLALAEAQFDATLSLPGGAIVPRKGFLELKRVLGDGQDTDVVHLGFSKNSCVVRINRTTLCTRLIEGQFPDYAQVIPQAGNKNVRLSRLAFADALRRVSLLSQARAHGVRFTFEPGNLSLLAEDPEFGDAKENFPIEYSGEPLTVGFNARYILDVLSLIGEQGVRFDLADELSPGVLRPLEDSSFLAVVMPMRI